MRDLLKARAGFDRDFIVVHTDVLAPDISGLEKEKKNRDPENEQGRDKILHLAWYPERTAACSAARSGLAA